MVAQKAHPQLLADSLEHAGAACTRIEHLSVDELRAIAVGDNFDGSCPVCGTFHLTRREISFLDMILR